jgi:UDP-N-acetylmuramate--alanine ligase
MLSGANEAEVWSRRLLEVMAKTTTTSFVATILNALDYDPTHIIGGIVSNLGGHARKGDGDILIAEADESDGSFLFLNPIMSVITNIDNDHLDYYKTEDNLLNAFQGVFQ